MSLSRTVRFYTLRFKRLQGSNRSLALGAAIGSAVGVAPTVPLNNILTLGLTLLFRVNPIAGIISNNIVSNPLTVLPLYFLAWVIGDFFLPGRLTWGRLKSVLAIINSEGTMASLETIRGLGIDTILVMMVGGLVIAIPAGIITYIIVFKSLSRFQKKRQQKHLLNRLDK